MESNTELMKMDEILEQKLAEVEISNKEYLGQQMEQLAIITEKHQQYKDQLMKIEEQKAEYYMEIKGINEENHQLRS